MSWSHPVQNAILCVYSQFKVAISGHRIPYYPNIWVPLKVCWPLVWHIYLKLIIKQPVASLRPKDMGKHGKSLNICDKPIFTFSALKNENGFDQPQTFPPEIFTGKTVFSAPIVNVYGRWTTKSHLYCGISQVTNSYAFCGISQVRSIRRGQ